MKCIVVFGDSIASDELDFEYDCWVTRLRKFANSIEETHVFNLSICGETSKGLLERIDNEARVRRPDIIIIQIGTNDARYNNVTEDSVETPLPVFKENIQKIIEICKKHTQKIIFVGPLPVDESKTTPTIWSKTEYFYNESIKRYNDVIKCICEKEGIPFVDLFSELVKTNYKTLLCDGLHPNSQGHQIIFERVKEFLMRNRVI